MFKYICFINLTLLVACSTSESEKIAKSLTQAIVKQDVSLAYEHFGTAKELHSRGALTGINPETFRWYKLPADAPEREVFELYSTNRTKFKSTFERRTIQKIRSLGIDPSTLSFKKLCKPFGNGENYFILETKDKQELLQKIHCKVNESGKNPLCYADFKNYGFAKCHEE
jgi:hypothetical protein